VFVGLRLLREYNANAMQLSVVVVVVVVFFFFFFFPGQEKNDSVYFRGSRFVFVGLRL
jgi:hypothetical protein